VVVEQAQLQRWRTSFPVLKDWVVAGGLLIIATTQQELAQPSGFDLPLEFAQAARETEAGMTQHVGLGAIARVFPERLALLDSEFRNKLGLGENHEGQGAGYTLPAGYSDFEALSRTASERLAKAVHTQVGLQFSLLTCFALLVGPFGYLYFVRRKARPLRYVGFVASAAVCFSLAVIVADVFANGVHVKASLRSAILIDQRVDRELGFEDAALFDPTGFGVELQPLAAGQWLLPLHSTSEPSTGLVLEPTGERMRIRHAVPPREPRWLGVRWLGRASGRLIVAADGGHGIAVENQLGRELRSLTVVHDGVLYTAGALARGQRVQLQPYAESEHEHWTAPPVPESPLLTPARALIAALQAGALSERHYVAQAAWTAETSSLIQDTPELVSRPELLITGVY
ncbi:MAG: hypothetical protein RL701_353, partial [Pseudomonadota bacterium]